jgi:hypothetical protein
LAKILTTKTQHRGRLREAAPIYHRAPRCSGTRIGEDDAFTILL